MDAADRDSDSGGLCPTNTCAENVGIMAETENEEEAVNKENDKASEEATIESLSNPFGSANEEATTMELDEENDAEAEDEEEYEDDMAGAASSSYVRRRRRPRTMNVNSAEEGARAEGGSEEEDEEDEDAEFEAKRRLFRLVGLYPRSRPTRQRRQTREEEEEEEEEAEEEEQEEEEEEEEEGEEAEDDEGTRSDAERRHDHSTDRNAQEVVTRRMRAEYKPATNRCSLLVPLPPCNGHLMSPGQRDSSPQIALPAAGPSPELCLPLLLRRRELGGSLCGRYGTKTWNGTSFTREVRRNSYMLRRLRRKSVLAVHSGCVNALNFSPVDGNLIASGSDDQQIAISDWMREKMVTKFDSGHEMNVFQTKFLFGSHHLLIASCARDGMVRLSTLNTSGDLVTSKLLFQHADSCNKVAVHHDEPFSVMSCGEDSAVVHVDIREPDSHRHFQVFEDRRSLPVPLYSIHAHPLRAHEFCVCGRDPVIRVFDRRAVAWGTAGSRADEFSAPLQEFCAFERQPGSQGLEKRLWSQLDADDVAMETCEPEAEVQTEEGAKAEEAEGEGERGDGDGDGAGEGPSGVQNDAGAAFLVNLHVTSAVYSHNGDAIIGSYNDADLFLFDTKPGREAHPSHKYCGHRNNTTVKCCNFYGPNSEYIISGSDCGNIFFWSRASEQIANFQTGDALGVVNVLEPHPCLPVLATSGLDSDVKIWTPEWSEELEEVNPKRWPFEEKMLGRTVLENWMDRESAKTMMIGQSALLRMLRIALQRRRARNGPMDTGDDESGTDDDDNGDDYDLGGGGGAGAGGGGDSDENGEGSRAFRRRDFCVQS